MSRGGYLVGWKQGECRGGDIWGDGNRVSVEGGYLGEGGCECRGVNIWGMETARVSGNRVGVITGSGGHGEGVGVYLGGCDC